MKCERIASGRKVRTVEQKRHNKTAKSMPRTYRRITTADGYSISVLARTRPTDRESRYKEIKSRLGSRARIIALRILKRGSGPVRRNGNQPTASHAH